MNTPNHSVTRLRQVEGALLLSTRPKVFTDDTIDRMSSLNRVLRWLRDNGMAALSTNLAAPRPTVYVRPIAASFLIHHAHGYNTKRMDDGERLSSVVVDGCTICWLAPASI